MPLGPAPQRQSYLGTHVCVCAVEGAMWTHTALLTLLSAVLLRGQGGATPLARRHTGSVLHGSWACHLYSGRIYTVSQ